MPAPILYLRGLRGATAIVMLALALAQAPVGVSWILDSTGYTYQVVNGALHKLKALGLASTCAGGDWQIVPPDKQPIKQQTPE